MKMHNQGLTLVGKACLGRRASVIASTATLLEFSLLIAVVLTVASPLPSQTMSRTDRDLAKAMLENISSDVEKNYFDPKLRGLDWDNLTKEAGDNIKNAPDMTVANAQIEGLLERLNDSHTNFLPPRNSTPVDYGWQFKIIGKRAFITDVSSKSDAESKGMRPGDELLTINGFNVDRSSAQKLRYAMGVLVPRTSIQVGLRDPTGKILQLQVNAKVTQHAAVYGLGGSSWWSNQRRIDMEDARDHARAEYKEISPELMILRIPAFFQIGIDVEQLFSKARDHKALIIDLRGTPGGRLDSVLDYLAGVFNHDVKAGQGLARNKATTITVKGKRHRAFEGDLIVLIDSESASGAEIFARVVQLEERGTILGDHSSGSVMEAQIFPHRFGGNPVYFYGSMVTVADT
ncbi:MAG TPA: S41 family peptidase, partial [Terracidiphilus sp.]|nr:S41 family peptidase [Terracidiphilus sp.]